MGKLIFDPSNYQVKEMTIDGITIEYRVFADIVYVAKPLEPKHQSLNIYVPEVYYSGESINGCNIKNAPIFFPITIGGYMPNVSDQPGSDRRNSRNATFRALEKGFVVVAPGARGRVNKNEEGVFTGKAPACIVDLKAAIRYLRFNKDLIPGDTDKIITNGTSAGGALSSLLGATGNHPDYDLYLQEAGACEAEDHVYASSCYCPITNLENADMAYEWMYYRLKDYYKLKFMGIGEDGPIMVPDNGVMSDDQLKVAEEIRRYFPTYINELALYDGQGKQLVLDQDGNGTFKEYVKSFVVDSMNAANEVGSLTVLPAWAVSEAGRIVDIDFESYVQFATRMKPTLAFDALDLSTGENDLFGTASIERLHFTSYAFGHSEAKGGMANPKIVKMLNPMSYLDDDKANMAKYWRIRHGAVDRDTSLAIPVILQNRLTDVGASVDFHLPWGEGHGGDYDLDELFAWMEQVLKK